MKVYVFFDQATLAGIVYINKRASYSKVTGRVRLAHLKISSIVERARILKRPVLTRLNG